MSAARTFVTCVGLGFRPILARRTAGARPPPHSLSVDARDIRETGGSTGGTSDQQDIRVVSRDHRVVREQSHRLRQRLRNQQSIERVSVNQGQCLERACLACSWGAPIVERRRPSRGSASRDRPGTTRVHEAPQAPRISDRRRSGRQSGKRAKGSLRREAPLLHQLARHDTASQAGWLFAPGRDRGRH